MSNNCMMDHRGRNELEKLVDQYGLTNLLDGLTTICAKKADHWLHNLRDDRVAAKWNLATLKVDQLAAWARKVGPQA